MKPNMRLAYGVSPLQRYLQCGDLKPSPKLLNECISRERDKEHPVPLADMYIDLASWDTSQDDEQSHLKTAGNILEEFLEDTEDMRQRGYDMEVRRRSQTATTARLRLLDLAVLANSRPESLTDNIYQVILQGYVDAIRDTDSDKGSLAEYLPLILANRVQNKGVKRSNIVGRMALSREDQRGGRLQGYNSRWDCGLFNGSEENFYEKPSSRIQVKLGKKQHVKEYEAGGVVVVSLKQLGLCDLERVIVGCCLEEGIETGILSEPFSPTYLDDKSSDLFAQVGWLK